MAALSRTTTSRRVRTCGAASPLSTDLPTCCFTAALIRQMLSGAQHTLLSALRLCLLGTRDLFHSLHTPCRVDAAPGAPPAWWHHRAVAADSGAQVQPGQDDLPQVRSCHSITIIIIISSSSSSSCSSNDYSLCMLPHHSCTTTGTTASIPIITMPLYSPWLLPQVLRTPAPARQELPQEEVWPHQPAAPQEEAQVIAWLCLMSMAGGPCSMCAFGAVCWRP
jgi:hypothetical protein